MKKNKKIIMFLIIILSIFIVTSNMIFNGLNNKYEKNYNYAINSIINNVSEKYPEVSESEIINLINSTSSENNNQNLLKKYGIDINKNSVLIKNQKDFNKYLLLENITILTFSLLLIGILVYYKIHEKNRIKQITKCLEEINRKNYEIKIDDNVEDELSILKNELYKTTIMLKEQAENSNNDKINLKKSLEDISHQLKTPLTSISILLDNLLDNENMDNETRMDFIKEIKKENIKINFLVQSLLKLSRFDVNVIEFNNKENSLKEIISTSVKNISTLCDLKNVSIQCNVDENIKINCDFNWQVEAFTNIIKNCVEHSNENGVVNVVAEQNKIYTKISIQDNGCGIDEKDIKHIFDRFYKGVNSGKDSIGIGLALSKSIIEKNNGKINVESEIGKGTTFEIIIN